MNKFLNWWTNNTTLLGENPGLFTKYFSINIEGREHENVY